MHLLQAGARLDFVSDDGTSIEHLLQEPPGDLKLFIYPHRPSFVPALLPSARGNPQRLLRLIIDHLKATGDRETLREGPPDPRDRIWAVVGWR